MKLEAVAQEFSLPWEEWEKEICPLFRPTL